MLPMTKDSGCNYHGCEVHAHSVCPAVLEHYERLTASGSALVRGLKFLEQSIEFGMGSEVDSPAQKKMFMDYRAALNDFEDALNETEPPRAAGG